MPLHEWQEFSGRLQAVDTVEVKPRVSGYINSVAFTDGARVKKGQLLFQIDPRPFQAEVDRLTSERSRAVSDLDLAKANHARAERLITANAISREEYDRQVAAETSAQGEVGSVGGSLANARLNLEFTEVRADRRSCLLCHHHRRTLVTSNSLLTTVVSTIRSMPTSMPTSRASCATPSWPRPGTMTAPAAAFMGLVDEYGYPHQGQLDIVDNQVDSTTGTIRARAVFANPDGRYMPGLLKASAWSAVRTTTRC